MKLGMDCPTTLKWAPNFTPSPHRGGVETWKNSKNRIFHFPIIKPCCKVVLINNFQRQSCSLKSLEGYRENVFEIDAYLGFLQWFQCMHLALVLCSMCCISETAPLICMCDAPLESIFNGLIGDRCAIIKHARWARPTAIAVLLVNGFFLLVTLQFTPAKISCVQMTQSLNRCLCHVIILHK